MRTHVHTHTHTHTQVKVAVDRKGVVQETVLIKQRALYVTQAEKTMNALAALRSATSAVIYHMHHTHTLTRT